MRSGYVPGRERPWIPRCRVGPAAHLKKTAGGKTYAEVSALSRQAPEDTKLAGQVQTLFRGETLRGLLLTAYGFWKMGQLALIGSIASLAPAVVLGLLIRVPARSEGVIRRQGGSPGGGGPVPCSKRRAGGASGRHR